MQPPTEHHLYRQDLVRDNIILSECLMNQSLCNHLRLDAIQYKCSTPRLQYIETTLNGQKINHPEPQRNFERHTMYRVMPFYQPNAMPVVQYTTHNNNYHGHPNNESKMNENIMIMVRIPKLSPTNHNQAQQGGNNPQSGSYSGKVKVM